MAQTLRVTNVSPATIVIGMRSLLPTKSNTFTADESVMYAEEIAILRGQGRVQVSVYVTGGDVIDAPPVNSGIGGTVNLLTVYVPPSSTVRIEVDVVARASDHSAGAAYKMVCAFTNQAGTLNRAGSDSLVSCEDTSGWGIATNISGETVQIIATGDSALVVTWKLTGRTLSV